MICIDEVEKLIVDGWRADHIGLRLGCSRQYVEQIAEKRGLSGLIKERRLAKRRERQQRPKMSAKYGITSELARQLRGNGATRAYTYQKNSANKRGIEWLFTLETWWAVWSESGHWDQRGLGGTKYVMARFRDEGSYSPSNVRICTCGENSKEMQALRKELRQVKECDTLSPA